VRGGNQVGLGRQLVGRVAPVGVGENPELALLDEGLQLFLHVGKVAADFRKGDKIAWCGLRGCVTTYATGCVYKKESKK
jgi:hypothetical protein